MNGISQLRCQDYGNGTKKIQKIEEIWHFRKEESQLNWVINARKQMIVQTERIQNTDMIHFNKLIRFLNKVKTKITLQRASLIIQ